MQPHTCTHRWDVSKLEPVVAAPHSPDNRKLARECSDVKIDRVYIGWVPLQRAGRCALSAAVLLACVECTSLGLAVCDLN